MRIIFLLLFSLVLFSSEFPTIFSSTGDKLYQNISKYSQVKELPFYKNDTEIFEVYCIDANKTLQEGLILDKKENDTELSVEKSEIKSYAKDLRELSKQNDNIEYRLEEDMKILYKGKDFKSLKVFKKLDIYLTLEIKEAIKQDTKKEKLSKIKPRKQVVEVKEEEIIQELKKELTPKAFYEKSLINLKDELYTLREENNLKKMSCINDITAINYWMLKILENKNDSCALVKDIKQMKTYDKNAKNTCGSSSMRYIEWHGRIKPYTGNKLFEAEATCR